MSRVTAANLMHTARRSRDVSLRELSRRSGISTSTLSRIEDSQIDPSFNTVMLALEALGYLPEVPLQEITSVGVDRANSNRRSEVNTDVTIDEAVEHSNLDRASLHSLMSRDLLKTSLRDGELVVSETELFAFERMAVNEERWSSQTQSAALDALTGFARSEPIHDRAASVLDGTTPEVLAGQVLIGRTSFWRADRLMHR